MEIQMSGAPETNKMQDTPHFPRALYGIAFLVIAIVMVGIYGIGRFNEIDLARDMQTWQEKLNLIAESRTADVNNWVSENFKELRALADNPSLQLYMTELQVMKSADIKTSKQPDS